MEINKVAVLGAGIMGSGIAQVFAQAGYEVVIRDIEEDILSNGVERIRDNLTGRVERGSISSEEKENILSRIDTTVELEEIEGRGLIVEAVPEEMELKKNIYEEVVDVVNGSTVIATNTSSLPITELANSVERPDKFIGMHFINPAPAIDLVEVIEGVKTSRDTLQAVKDVSEDIGKTPVIVKDSPGFALNRLLIPIINEAFYMLQEGIADSEEIDRVMKLGANHPMGPLELGDLVGLDTVLHIMEVLHDEFGESKYRPCPLLRKYVRAGELGRKSGEGVYDYE